MIGIEQDNVLIVVIVRGNVIKKIAELAVHRLHLIAIDILTKRVWLEKYRSTRILLLQCIFDRQMGLRFCRRWNIAIVGM